MESRVPRIGRRYDDLVLSVANLLLMAYVVYRLGTECLDLADLTLSDYAQHRRRGNSMNLPACTMDLTAYGDSVMGGHAGMFRTAKRRLFRSLPTSVRYAPPDWLSMS